MIRKKRGRPKLNEIDKRTRIDIRLSSDELELLNNLSEKMKQTKTKTIVEGLKELAKIKD